MGQHIHKPVVSVAISCKRLLSSSTVKLSKELKEAPESNNSQVSTSFAEKAKNNAKTGGYGLVIVAGLGVIAAVVGTILKNYFLQTVPTVCMTGQCWTVWPTT